MDAPIIDPDAHRHVWAKSGCWCGAQRCSWLGVEEGGTLTMGLLGDRLLNVFHGCMRGAEEGDYCLFHAIANNLLAYRSVVYESEIVQAMAQRLEVHGE